MKKDSCVIWDWNGTLLDDVDVCVSTMNEMLLERGKDPLAGVEHYRQLFRFPVMEYYKSIGWDFSKDPFEDLAKTYMGKYRKNSRGCELHVGSIEVIKTIHRLGIAQIILSASERKDLQNQVDALKIGRYFDCILGLDDIYARSKVDLGKRWIQEQHIRRDKIVLIGDTTHDYEVAQELGCHCILFANGHQSKAVLERCNCAVVDRV